MFGEMNVLMNVFRIFLIIFVVMMFSVIGDVCVKFLFRKSIRFVFACWCCCVLL